MSIALQFLLEVLGAFWRGIPLTSGEGSRSSHSLSVVIYCLWGLWSPSGSLRAGYVWGRVVGPSRSWAGAGNCCSPSRTPALWVCIPVPPPLLSMHCVLHVERGESPLLLCFEYFPPKCSLFSAGKGKNLCCPGSLFLSELLLTTSSWGSSWYF